MRFVLRLALPAILAIIIQAELTHSTQESNDAIHQREMAINEEEEVRNILKLVE